MKTVTRTGRAGRLVLATAAAALALVSPAFAQGITLKVFGGSALDTLGPRQSPEVQAEIRDQVISGFLAEHPEVEAVEWDAQGALGDSVQRVLTAFLAEQEIDLISCSAYYTNGTYARRGLLRPITEQIQPFVDRIEPAALNAFEIGGEIYGVPITTMSTSTIYYNKDLFAELGIPTPPTYEDLVAGVPGLTAAGYIPLLHQGANTVMWPMWYFETYSQASGDPIDATTANLAGEATFNDEAEVAAFALIRQWVDDGILSPDSLAVDQDGMRAAFASQRSAMYYGGTWEIPSLQENVTDFEWGTFPFPQMPGTTGSPGHGGGADNGICMSASIPDEKVEAAVAFMEYLTRPEVAAIYLDPEAPLATSIVGVAGIDEPYAADLRATTFPDTIKFLDWMWPSEVTTAVASSIGGVVGGEMTPEAAADAVQAAYDQMVADGTWPPAE